MSDMHSSSSSSSSHDSHQAGNTDLSSYSSAEATPGPPAAQVDGCTHIVSNSVSNSNSSSKDAMDPATAAAAAALGAEADRLLKALNLRMEQHHPERRNSKQQGRRHLKGMPAHRRLAAALDEDGLGFGEDAGCGVSGGDEPICIPEEYLRL
jgi:hypothetical protein